MNPAPVRYERGSFHFEGVPIAEAYVDRVEELSPPGSLPPGMDRTDLVTAYQVASSLIGVPGAVAIAGEVLNELCGPECRQELDQALLADQGLKPETQLAGTDIPLAFGQPEEFGQANFTSVTLDPQLRDFLGYPLGDFVAGHEAGHLRQGDLVKSLGRSFLTSFFAGLDEEAGLEIQGASDELMKKAELAADEAGVKYALDRGHSPQAILEATDYLLGLMPDGDARHPDAEQRRAQIHTTLKS